MTEGWINIKSLFNSRFDRPCWPTTFKPMRNFFIILQPKNHHQRPKIKCMCAAAAAAVCVLCRVVEFCVRISDSNIRPHSTFLIVVFFFIFSRQVIHINVNGEEIYKNTTVRIIIIKSLMWYAQSSHMSACAPRCCSLIRKYLDGFLYFHVAIDNWKLFCLFLFCFFRFRFVQMCLILIVGDSDSTEDL